MYRDYRLASYALILGGIACILILIFADHEALVIREGSNFFIKYLVFICLYNAATILPIFGILFLTDNLKPWYSPDISEIEKAKLYVYSSIGCSPIYATLIVVLITYNESLLISVAWAALLTWLGYCVIKSIIIMLKNR